MNHRPNDGGPFFTRHALRRAAQRYPQLAEMPEGWLVPCLKRSLLAGHVVDTEPAFHLAKGHGKSLVATRALAPITTIYGHVHGEPIEFMVDPDTGHIVTIIRPDTWGVLCG